MRKSITDDVSVFAGLLKKYIPALALITGIWLFSQQCCQFMLIQGESMLPAYRDKQLVLLDKYSRDYQQGDVIAFLCDDLEMVLVKRIAAVAGSTVQIRDGQLIIDGEVISGITILDAGIAGEELTVPEGCFFVLGDNLERSIDSRSAEVGMVSSIDILGKVINNSANHEQN